MFFLFFACVNVPVAQGCAFGSRECTYMHLPNALMQNPMQFLKVKKPIFISRETLGMQICLSMFNVLSGHVNVPVAQKCQGCLFDSRQCAYLHLPNASMQNAMQFL